MRIKFWGVRGTTPTPERRNSRYGGNTTCVEVRLANGTLIILDAGSGLRALGLSLVRKYGDLPIHACFFLTHFHWSHVQGIPFFLPLYDQKNSLVFYANERNGHNLRTAIEDTMHPPYFPDTGRAIQSQRYYQDVHGHSVNVNGAVITSAQLNHPQGSTGYRIEADGSVLVFATDTEPGSPFHDRELQNLARGADLLVYDAQYTPEQLARQKKGRGHSSWLDGARLAGDCGVKRLFLFHHDPASEDIFIDDLVEKARRNFPHVTAAAEGLEVELPAGEIERSRQAAPPDRRHERRYRLEVPVRLTWKDAAGEKKSARGLCQDFSRSGVYLLGPADLGGDQPIDVELVLPDEITRCGEMTFQYKALVVRKNPPGPTAPPHIPAVGIAMRLLSEASHLKRRAA